MDFTELYAQKKMTAAQAAALVKSGDWVDYGFCAIHPRVLDEALARRAAAVAGVLHRHRHVHERVDPGDLRPVPAYRHGG